MTPSCWLWCPLSDLLQWNTIHRLPHVVEHAVIAPPADYYDLVVLNQCRMFDSPHECGITCHLNPIDTIVSGYPHVIAQFIPESANNHNFTVEADSRVVPSFLEPNPACGYIAHNLSPCHSVGWCPHIIHFGWLCVAGASHDLHKTVMGYTCMRAPSIKFSRMSRRQPCYSIRWLPYIIYHSEMVLACYDP